MGRHRCSAAAGRKDAGHRFTSSRAIPRRSLASGTARGSRVSRNYRDLVTEALALSGADLIERLVDMALARAAYRDLLTVALGQLHEAGCQLDRQREQGCVAGSSAGSHRISSALSVMRRPASCRASLTRGDGDTPQPTARVAVVQWAYTARWARAACQAEAQRRQGPPGRVARPAHCA